MSVDLILFLSAVGEKGPEPEDVVAGWIAFAMFGLLILAVAVLGFSLTKRLKNVEAAAEAGLYDPSTKKKRVTLNQQGAPEVYGSANPDDPDLR